MISEDDILRICFMKGVRRGITWTDYRQQYAFLSNELGHLQVDFVGRFESLQRDFDKITERLSIERTVLPKLNATNHRHYSTYYTERTKDLVARLYRTDVEYFGYTFEQQ